MVIMELQCANCNGKQGINWISTTDNNEKLHFCQTECWQAYNQKKAAKDWLNKNYTKKNFRTSLDIIE